MDDNTRIELEALLCEKEGMLADNALRALHGESPAWGGDAFDELASRIRALGGEEEKPQIPGRG